MGLPWPQVCHMFACHTFGYTVLRSASTTVAAANAAQAPASQGGAGLQLQQVLAWTDGCSAQFKCAAAINLHRQIACELGVPVQWNYFATSHGKGRHDSEGGAVKQLLGRAIQVQQDSSSLMCTAPQLQAYAAQHLTRPARRQAPSQAHRERAPVEQRTFLLQTDQDVQHWLENTERTELEQHLLMVGAIQGVRAWHQSLFSPSRSDWYALYRGASCACSSCLLGGQQCASAALVPAWEQLPLFCVTQLEYEVWNLFQERGVHTSSWGCPSTAKGFCLK
eukprot:1145688-Pelagomonas_calceolata.AAC.2